MDFQKLKMWKKKEPKKKWIEEKDLKSFQDLSDQEKYNMAMEMVAQYAPVPSEQRLLLFQPRIPHLIHQDRMLRNVYNTLSELLEFSAYARVSATGIQFEKFPKSIKSAEDKAMLEKAKKTFDKNKN